MNNTFHLRCAGPLLGALAVLSQGCAPSTPDQPAAPTNPPAASSTAAAPQPAEPQPNVNSALPEPPGEPAPKPVAQPAAETPIEPAKEPPAERPAQPAPENRLPKLARRDPGARAQEAPAEGALAEPPRPLVMPHVALSTGHQATCKVMVGDAFPAAALKTADGADKSLDELKGAKLTVVMLWQHADPYAVGELGELQRDVFEPYGAAGVGVVAVHVGDDAAAAASAAAERGATYPLLIDGDGALYGQVATGMLPRTYLLDAAGKILWFDIEYSRTTHRELLAAVAYALEQAN